jgi:hypothetical protein
VREETEAVEILGGGDERAVFIRGIDEFGFEGDKRPGLGNGGESLAGDNTNLTCCANDGTGSKGGGKTGGASVIGGDNGDESDNV